MEHKGDFFNVIGYPVLVRKDIMHMFVMEQDADVKEAKEISLRFSAAHWLKDGKDISYDERGAFIIFVSEKTFHELSCSRRFSPHYIDGKGWRCAGDLSSETRNELLSLAMGKEVK